MKHELLLLRHGKSDWNTTDTDYNRPITDRGKRGAQKIGVWLAQHDLQPDRIVSSPAERAKTTAYKMVKAMGDGVELVDLDERLYAASVSDIFAVIAELSENDRRVMLVGHNPSFEFALMRLCDNEMAYPDDGKLMPTATLAHIKVSGTWRELVRKTTQCTELVAIQRPRSLPKTFPFPSVSDPQEQRIRPAYYYNQSSVIPYRYHHKTLEVMVIMSSKKKHFVIPKGIHEPGLSGQDSAALEALEEAGVRGIVAPQAIGHYSYQKWDATCQVTVYPMQVLETVSEDHWHERHRTRQWVSPEKAAKQLFQKELKKMVLNLEKFLINSQKETRGKNNHETQ